MVQHSVAVIVDLIFNTHTLENRHRVLPVAHPPQRLRGANARADYSMWLLLLSRLGPLRPTR